MSTHEWDAIVVGAGVRGAAVFAHCAAGGRRTLLVEKRRLGEKPLAPRVPLRIFHPDWFVSNLAVAGAAAFQALDCGFVPGNVLSYFPRARLSQLRREVGRLNGLGARLELVPEKVGRARFAEWPSGMVAVYEPDAGTACPELARQAWLSQGRKAGGEVVEECEISGIMVRQGRVEGAVSSSRLLGAPLVFVTARAAAYLVAPHEPIAAQAIAGPRGLLGTASGARGLVYLFGWGDEALVLAPELARRALGLIVEAPHGPRAQPDSALSTFDSMGRVVPRINIDSMGRVNLPIR